MTARPSRHTSRRSFHSSSVEVGASGPKLVSRSSESEMSHSTSKGSRPCSVAISPMVRPTYWRFSGCTTSKMRLVVQSASPTMGPGDLACSSSFLRAAGSARIAVFSALGSVITCSQPGRASSTKPAANERRMPNGLGMVRATTLPPLARATSPADSWFSMFGALSALITRMFQLSGRWAAADMSAISSLAHGSNGPTIGRNSSEVPSCSPATRHSSTSSCSVA